MTREKRYDIINSNLYRVLGEEVVKKIIGLFLLFLVSSFSWADIKINNRVVSNGDQEVIYKYIAKQDIGYQGESFYYLLQNIPISVTAETKYQIEISNDAFSKFFENGTNFYLDINRSRFWIPILSKYSNYVVTSGGTLSSGMDTNLSLYISGVKTLLSTTVGNSAICNIVIRYGDNLQYTATIQLIVTYDPSEMDLPDGYHNVVPVKAVESSLYFDLGKNYKGQKPSVTSSTKSFSIYTATRNIVIQYVPDLIQTKGVEYGYQLKILNFPVEGGSLSTEQSSYFALNASHDQVEAIPVAVTIYPLDSSAIYTQSGSILMQGEFIITYSD